MISARRPLQICIGYDPKAAIAYHVLSHSIMRRASRPVTITPLYLPQLRTMGVYTRERGPTESTEFSLTRFLTPWITGFNGISIFMDCDVLCRADICELADIAIDDPYKDVFVVKHDYVPSANPKFLGNLQTNYPCKNWSSVMVFNNHRYPTRSLTPDYVNRASPAELHRFKWAAEIGELPAEWNHLVGEIPPNPNAKLVHYTLGGPWFPGYETCEFAADWFAEASNALTTDDRPFTMGNTPTGAQHGDVPGFARSDNTGLLESL